MLVDSGIFKCFWAEAVNTTCYTHKKSMINKNHGKTPSEIWHGKKSVVSYFKIFECKCYIHNNGKSHLTEFDAKSDGGFFLGYSVVIKAYRVFNKRTINIVESIHVVFYESTLTDKPADTAELTHLLTEISLEDDSDDEVHISQNILQTPKLEVVDQSVRQEGVPVDQFVGVPIEDVLQTNATPTEAGPTGQLQPEPVVQNEDINQKLRWNRNHPSELVIDNP